MQLTFLEIHNSFKFFDFHSRDLHGTPHSFGTCTLLSVEGLENLISYLQLSRLKTCTIPFKSDYNEILFDFIAPNTQNIELQDKAEGTEDLHPDLNENYDLSHTLGIPSTSFNSEPMILNELPDDEMVQTLNKKQKAFFIIFCTRLKTQISHFIAF